MTRIIGPTATEFAALDRGATLILGVPREGMEPIVSGQELLAVGGWNYPDTVNPDAGKVRLRVTGEPVPKRIVELNMAAIGLLTGIPRKNDWLAECDLIAHVGALEVERKNPLPWGATYLLIPVEVLPGAQEEVA